VNASPPQRWPRRSSWRNASGEDLSQDRRRGCPLKAPCLHQEGLSQTMDLWEAGDPHPRSRLGYHPHRSGGPRHHQSGCSSATRQNPPRRVKGGKSKGGGGAEEEWVLQCRGQHSPSLLGYPGCSSHRADPVQRLALMMALMVLGMSPVYSCHVPTGCGMLLGVDTSEPRICPPIGTETRIRIPALKTEMDEEQWVRLPAIRCVAMQSSLIFTCG
jgi:hypothetical protein